MTAGYSGTPLARKLGFKPGMRAHYAHAPDGFHALLGPELPEGVRVLARPAGGLDLVDVKVCAIDETWSGLKLVTRRELR